MTAKEWMHKRLDELADDPSMTSRAMELARRFVDKADDDEMMPLEMYLNDRGIVLKYPSRRITFTLDGMRSIAEWNAF